MCHNFIFHSIRGKLKSANLPGVSYIPLGEEGRQGQPGCGKSEKVEMTFGTNSLHLPRQAFVKNVIWILSSLWGPVVFFIMSYMSLFPPGEIGPGGQSCQGKDILET